jgi:hypothetical protein
MAVSAGVASLLLARRGGTAVEAPRLRSVEVIEEAAPARQLLQDPD